MTIRSDSKAAKGALQTLTFLLDKESLSRSSWAIIGSGVFPLFLPLAFTAFRGPEGYFSLVIIAVTKHFEHLS